MVQLLRREPVTEYELRDAGGRPIGQVIQPAGRPRTGPGGGNGAADPHPAVSGTHGGLERGVAIGETIRPPPG